MKKVALVFPFEDRIPLQATVYHAFMPRYGILPVGGALRAAGYDVRIFCEMSGSRLDWRWISSADAVCFSLMSFSAQKGYEYAARVRSLTRAPLIFGGSHPSVLPEECLDHCDYVVRNEGEATLLALLDALARGGALEGVEGVSFKGRDGKPVHNPSRPFLEKLDIVADPTLIDGYERRSLWFTLRDAFRNGVPRFNIAVAQGSRGCPYGCRFCFVAQELGTAYRPRDPRIVLQEIERAVEHLGTRYVLFVDNDFAWDRAHALAILRLLEHRFRGDLDLFFFTRIFIARDPELLEAATRAGRTCIGLGIESVEPDTLRLYAKGQKLDDIEDCLERMRTPSLSLLLMFVFGSDSDTVASVRRALDFSMRFRVHNVGLCSLYDFPTRGRVLGTSQIVPDHRFIHRDWRFFGGNYVVHYPKRIPPSVLQHEIASGLRRFYRENLDSFYQYFPAHAVYGNYVDFLRSAEQGLYDDEGVLREDRLPGPLAQERRLDIRMDRVALAGERARFYWGNLTRRGSWKYLLSLLRRPSPLAVMKEVTG